MYQIFTKLWPIKIHHCEMSFSGTTISKFVKEEISHELFTWEFDILIFLHNF